MINQQTVQSGNWSDPTIWLSGTVPRTGDTVTVGHAVTLDTNADLGSSNAGATALILNANLTINPGVTLTLRGNVVQANGVTVTGNGNGKILFDATQAASPTTTRWTWQISNNYIGSAADYAKFLVRGTAGSRFLIQSVSGGGNGHFTNGGNFGGGWVDAEYGDFLRIGDSSTLPFASNSENRDGVLRLDHCRLINCGQVSHANTTGTAIPVANGAATFQVNACSFLRSLAATELNATASAALTTGTWAVTNNDFDQAVTLQSAFTISGNTYRSAWTLNGASQSATAGPYPALSYAFSGPSTLVRGSASSNYMVALADGTTSAGDAITLSDGSAGGSFSPASLSLSTASPSATFTYTPAVTGPITLSAVDANGLWIETSSIHATATTPATTYNLTGPATLTALAGQPSENFTVALPAYTTVSGTLNVTLSDGGAGGTFTPGSVGLTSASPAATFTYTPASGASAGQSIPISVTNDGGLANPASVTLTIASPVTTYTLTGPTSGDVAAASGNFTVTLGSGAISGSLTFTPAASNGDGSFSPSSVTLTNSNRSATFTYSPTLYGSRTISTTNSGGLPNPSPVPFLGMVQIGKSDNWSYNGSPSPSLGGFDMLTFGYLADLKRDVTSDPVDPNSDIYIQRLAGTTIGLNFSASTANGGNTAYGMPYNVVRGDTPTLPLVLGAYGPESEPGPVPWPASGMVFEGIAGNLPTPNAAPTDGSDHHNFVFVRDEATGGVSDVWEYYQSYYPGDGQWYSSGGAKWNLKALAGASTNNPATARCVVTGGVVTSVTLLTGGSGYTEPPQVYIQGGSGKGAQVTATVSGGSVTSLTLVDGGSGYDTQSYVSFGGPRLDGATSGDAAGLPMVALCAHYDQVASGDIGHALRFTVDAYKTVDPATATATITGGVVTGLTLTHGGSGYLNPPAVTITGDGTGAAATATVDGSGHVNGLNLTSGGSGYTTATVSFSGLPLSRSKYIFPARHTAYSGSSTEGLPFGTRLRLTSAWYAANAANFTGQARPIVDAMRTYGLILADLGGTLRIDGTNDSRWVQSDLNQLTTIPAAAFEVLKIEPDITITGPSSIAAGQSGTYTIQYQPASDSHFGAYIYVYYDTVPTVDSANRVPIGTYSITDTNRTQTFTFTPPSAGTWYLGWFNTVSDHLMSPFAKVTAGSGAATTFSLTPPNPASGIVGQVSQPFTVAPNGSFTGTMTLSDGGAGGTFTPTSLTWNNSAASMAFSYTPASVGSITITVTDSSGTLSPSTQTASYTSNVLAVKDYTLTGPSTGTVGVASSNFTVTLGTGTLANTLRITPDSGGAGGTFTPAYLDLTNTTRSGAFSYTAASAGTVTISTTNNGNLTNPAALTYQAAGVSRQATTLKSGDWSDPTVWDTGIVPGAGDTATINHNLTITTNQTIGTSGAAGTFELTCATGTLTIKNGAVLTLRGDATFGQYNPAAVLYPLTIEAGSGIEFDPPSGQRYKINVATDSQLNINGTSASRAFIRTKAGAAGLNGYITGSYAMRSCAVSAAYCDFTRLGDSGTAAIEPILDSSRAVFRLDHCTFETCGPITVSPNDPGVTLSINQSIWKNSAAAYTVQFGATTTPTGTWAVTGCYFDKGLQAAGDCRGISFTGGNFITDGLIGVSGGYNPCVTMSDFFLYRKTDGSEHIWPGPSSNGYVFGDSYGGTGPEYNAHMTNIGIFGANYSDIIFDAMYSQRGKAFIVSGPTSGPLVVSSIRNCITLPNAAGGAFGTLAAGGGTDYLDLILEHNTVYTSFGNTTERDCCYLGETYFGHANQYESVKSNIAWSRTSNAGFLFSRSADSAVQDLVSAANLDYNCLFNQSGAARDLNGTNSMFTSGTPQTHGVVADPQFVDDSRNLATFATGYLGRTAGTAWVPSGQAYSVGDIVSHSNASVYGNRSINYRCIQAHTSGVGNDEPGTSAASFAYWELQSLYEIRNAVQTGLTINDASLGLSNSSYPSALVAWTKAGFAPRNTALQAAHDAGSPTTPAGAWIGAVQGQAVVAAVTSYDLGAPSPSSGRVGKPSSPFTVTLGSGTLTGSVRITPSVSNGSGSFSPAFLDLTDTTRSGAFTFTPSSLGTCTIACTNSQALLDPPNVTYTSSKNGPRRSLLPRRRGESRQRTAWPQRPSQPSSRPFQRKPRSR